MHLGNPRRYFVLPQIPTKHGLKAGPFNKPHLWPCGFSTFFSTVFEEVCEAQGEEGDCGFEDQGDCEAQDCEAQGAKWFPQSGKAWPSKFKKGCGEEGQGSAPEMWTGSASASAAAADTGRGKYSKNVN